MEMRQQRIGIFIDLNNVEMSVEGYNELGWSLDYSDLVSNLCDDRRLLNVIVYDSRPVAENRRRLQLHDSLKSNGFDVRILEPCYNRERSEIIQKEVDTSIVADSVMMCSRNLIDVAVIVSGDRDMRPAVNTIRSIGKSAEVASFPSVLSDDLRYSCDVFHDLQDMYLLCPSIEEFTEDAPNIASFTITPRGCVHGQ